MKTLHRPTLSLAAAALLATSLQAASLEAGDDPAADWPGWRGPTGDGVVSAGDVPLRWSDEENVRWKVELGMPANGSPTVRGDRIFLTTPEDAAGLGRTLECYSREDGRKLWSRTVEIDREMPTHETNPYCGTTPAVAEDRVVVWHASAGLHCYDLDGEPLWSRDLGEFRHIWGYGTSPVLHGGRVYLNTGPGARTFMTALDLESGETLWETEEPDVRTEEELEARRIAGSWCTPIIVERDGRSLLVCGQPTRVVAYDLDSGSIVWTCDGIRGTRGNLTYSSPVVAGDTCVFVGGWQGPTLGVRLGPLDGEAAEGDAEEGDAQVSRQAWRHAGQMSNCASGAYMNGRIFVPDMRGILWCIDPATGLPDWKERVARGGTWGSIVSVGDRMYLLGQSGTTVVFKADAEGLEVLAENVIDERTNSTLAVAGGEIFLRTHEHLYCIAAPPAESQR